MGLLKEFREFAIKGNVVDMGVGVVLGVAFNKMVQSIVNDLILPPLGMLLGKVPFKELAWVLQPATETVGVISIKYGLFLNACIEFSIIALTVFIVVKIMNKVNVGIEKLEEFADKVEDDITEKVEEVEGDIKERIGIKDTTDGTECTPPQQDEPSQ